MADLTVQKVTTAGVTPTLTAAAAGGDTFANDGKTFLIVKNADVSDKTVTIDSVEQCNQGFDHNLVVTVTAGTEKWIGPFGQRFNNADVKVSASYSAVTSVTVGAVSVR